MFRSIQVPLDGSSFADHALPLAVHLAQRDGAALQIIRVHVPLGDIHLHAQGRFVATLDRELMEDARDNLADTAQALTEKTGASLNSVLLTGPIVETLAQHAGASGADLLVMTTQGYGPLGRAWFGSVADSLIRQSPIPILFVKPQEESPRFSPPPAMRHVLIPLDGSQLAEQALEPASSLVSAVQGQFTLLRVVPAVIPAAYAPARRASGLQTSWHQHLYELKSQLETEASEYLERTAERLRAQSLDVRTCLVAHEQPAEAIIDAASNLGVDAMALTTRGQGGLKRFFLGSVADKVLRSATMPLLLCPPKEPEAQAAA